MTTFASCVLLLFCLLSASLSNEQDDIYLAHLQKNYLNEPVNNVSEFWRRRNGIADLEVSMLLGYDMPLNEQEMLANAVIQKAKFKEFDKSRDPATFPPANNFFKVRQQIRNSDIYLMILSLPKGANLYCLLLTMVDLQFIYQLTFEDGLYFRYDTNFQFRFSKNSPGRDWRLLSAVRNSSNRQLVDDLNKSIMKSLTVNDPDIEFNEMTGWNKALAALEIYSDLVAYQPNFVKFFRRVLEILQTDKIAYAEIGYNFPDLYDLNGVVYNASQTMRYCIDAIREFVKTAADFRGARYIYVPIRFPNRIANVPAAIERATALWREFPDLILGIGAIRQEAFGEPLSDFAEALLNLPKGMKIFISAGFTLNWGEEADYNILDALALNPAALREPFALNKHPLVLEELRRRDIPVEFSPLAAQALGYIKDMRNHPFAYLMATNFPLVIGSSLGTLWNAIGLRYDWYEAYLALTPRFADIRWFKQLAINSFLYSNMPIEEKRGNITAWLDKWYRSLNYLINRNGTLPTDTTT